MVTLQPLTVPFWALLMENTSLIHLLQEKSGKLSWIYCNRMCFIARFRSLLKNTLIREERGTWQSQRNRVRARRLGATGETALGVLGNRHEEKLTGRPSREVPQWLPQLAVDKRRGTDNLHKDWTEVSSSPNLSAILTLETAPGNAATSGSPPCCDIVVAHTFGPCQCYCPHLPFPMWLLLPAFAFSGTHLRLSSLCPTSGGVDCWAYCLRF